MDNKQVEQTYNKEYKVEFEEAALRDLKKLTKQVQRQVLDVAKSLATNPRPTGVESLTKYKGLYRVRSGNYRIVYQVEDDKLIVLIVAIADRKQVYEVVERRYN